MNTLKIWENFCCELCRFVEYHSYAGFNMWLTSDAENTRRSYKGGNGISAASALPDNEKKTLRTTDPPKKQANFLFFTRYSYFPLQAIPKVPTEGG